MLSLQRIGRLRLRPMDVRRRIFFSTLHAADPSLVDARQAPTDYTDGCAVVYTDFVTPEESDLLSNAILARMKRRRYAKGHWDAVITLYKEIELPDDSFDSPEIPELFQRIRRHLEEASHVPPECTWLPSHTIDLKQDGQLTAHVDSIKFSGGLVAGISLLTPSIMRLIPDQQTAEQAGWVDLYLPPLSLYAMTGVGRYSYTHELLPSGATFESSTGNQIAVERGHRLSVIFRDAKAVDE